MWAIGASVTVRCKRSHGTRSLHFADRLQSAVASTPRLRSFCTLPGAHRGSDGGRSARADPAGSPRRGAVDREMSAASRMTAFKRSTRLLEHERWGELDGRKPASKAPRP